MSDCVFCGIIRGEIPAEKVYEDSDMIAFLDINPVSDGHLLVIPREHHEWMYDVPDSLIEKMYVKAKDLMVSLKKAMKADFVALSVIGVDVPHFHIQLVPRYKDDGLKDFWPSKKYGEGEADEVAEKIREEIDSQ